MSTALATLAGKMAERVGMDSVDPQELITTLRQTAFKGDASDAQFIALLIVANQYGLNPWTKEIYAFPDKQNGIVPVVGVDGWSRIINENQQFDGMDFEQDNESCTWRVLTRWCRSSSKKWTKHWLKLVLYLESNGDDPSSR